MSFEDPTRRQPKGDHNRRLSLGLDPDDFAAEAGVTTEELREYERTAPDHRFDPSVAARVGNALDRLEKVLPNSQTGRQEPASGTEMEKSSNPSLDAGPTGPRYTAEGGEDDLPGADGKLWAVRTPTTEPR